MARTDIPLLNHYKKEFVAKRLPQTFLGGVSLRLGYSAPCYIYLGQILLWLLPFVIGGSFTLAIEVGGLQPLYGSIGNGVAVGMITFLLQFSSKIIKNYDSNRNHDEVILSSDAFGPKNAERLLAEEDEIFFDSLFSSKTLLFIIPPKRNYASVVVSSLVSAFVSGLGVWYCLPHATFTALYSYNMVGSVFLFIFSWITICIGHYPLVIGSPVPETAAHRSVDFYGIQNLSRALHISLFFCPFLVDIIVTSSTLTDVNNILHILFCILPFLWFVGIMPPFDALVLWALEQFLISGLGGSSMSTDWRLLFMFASSSAVLVGLTFATSTQVLISCSLAFGFLLSVDITSMIFHAVQKFRYLMSIFVGRRNKVERLDSGSPKENQKPKKSYPWKLILVWSAMFCFSFAGTFLGHYYSSSINQNSSVKPGFEFVFIVIFPITVMCKELQKVYIFIGVFRNCIYPLSTLSQKEFITRKRYLKVFGLIHAFLTHFVFPLLSSIYLSFYLFGSTTFLLPSFEVALGCVHGLRFVWQRPGRAVSCFAVLSVFNLIPNISNSAWGSLFLGTRLIILDACWDRLFRFFDNLWFAVALTVTSWTDKKQRRSETLPLIVLNIIFLPVTLCIIFIASVLSAPLLPVFTLPFFIIGFPHQARFWPEQPGSMQANICQDTVYYVELTDSVSQWISREIGLGVVDTPASSSVGVSQFYIARSQDRTLFIQVLESGFGYTSILIKGLEMQETSCHALEATRLDDAFDIAFEKSELDLRCLRTNHYFGTSSVTAVDSTFLDSHSDAKSSLRGIVDHPDAMRQLRSDFLKCLSWVLSHYLVTKSEDFTEQKSTAFLDEDSKSGKSVLISSDTLQLPNAIAEGDDIALTTPRADSVASFTSILSSDEGRPTSKLGKRHNRTREEMEMKARTDSPRSRLNTSKKNMKAEQEVDDFELDSILSDSGYGLPATDADFKKGKNEAIMSKRTFAKNAHLAESYVHLFDGNVAMTNGSAALNVALEKWNEVPISKEDIDESKKVFDSTWLEHCLKLASEKNSNPGAETLLPAITNLVLSCDAIVNIIGVPGKDPSLLGSDHMRHVYAGSIPWSPALEWLTTKEDLHHLVIKSYRYAVKLMYDAASLGTYGNFDELEEYLREYDDDWYIGTEMETEWRTRLADGRSNLFAISHESPKNAVNARVLTRQPISLHLARLNQAAVRAIWANFSVELIYATNDDEERYSIQAHASLLRNMVVQTADPPLGYPILSTYPLTIPTFLFFL